MTNNEDTIKEQLKKQLREIFQFENEDLDFGIYRIMNYKRNEIEKFIEEELIAEIKKQLELIVEEEIKKIKEKLEEIRQKIKESLGENAFENGELAEQFRDTPLGKEYYQKKRQLEEIKISEELEKEIYNHLINFFSRYYDKGDFISKRRYGKNEKYAIPYNGEDVLLYWSNKDQYYIKTTEYFRRYAFRVKGLTANFKVVEAEEEKGNIKSPEKKFFVLNEKIFDFNESKKELNIYFEYRGLTEEEEAKYQHGQSASQDKINEDILRVLQEKIPQNSLARLIFEKDSRSQNEKSHIEKHLYRYTRRNTTDYFIHKDLKDFLERELDFYIKNEFLQLEDLQILDQSGYFDKLILYLIGVRVFRNIALKIIEFLAQIENFQKTLWEKKKFVLNTHYVITLDKIKEYAGEEFLESILDEILRNEKQLKEWNELFGIEINRKDDLIETRTLQGKEWKKLPIDTKYFDEEFKWKLLIALTKNNNLDDILDGVLIKSENFQALNLLLNKYREKIKTIYIDPPYNTGSDGFLYKDNYQHSSWLTMMENRLGLARELLKDDGVIFVSIDDNEVDNLSILSTYFFEHSQKFIWRKKSSLSYLSKQAISYHEYIITLSNQYLPFVDPSDKTPANQGVYPVFKSSNPFSERILRKGINVNGIKDKIYPKGEYTVGKQKIYLLDDLIIRDYKLYNDVRVKARFVVSQKYIDENKDKIVINPSLAMYYSKEEENKEPKAPLTIIDGEELTTRYATEQMKKLFGDDFSFPTMKPETLVEWLCLMQNSNSTSYYVLDFFAGSGTTAHAVMKLNKEDGGKRKFILVEMADYFETVIIPRIKKVAYSFNWKEGKPQDMDGIGVFFKYHTLEQYEDALENIEFEEAQSTLYEFSDYFVRYMLGWETKNSKTFLNIDEMTDPFNYKLKIIENYQQRIVNVDLIETFNYLLGLNVSKYKVMEDNNRKYVFVFGEKDGKRIAVVWRSAKDLDFEKDRKFIEANIEEFSPNEIYINKDAVVKGFKSIEPLFKSLMFDKVE